MVRIASVYSLYILLCRYSPGVTTKIPWLLRITSNSNSKFKSHFQNSKSNSNFNSKSNPNSNIPYHWLLRKILESKNYINIIHGPHVAEVKVLIHDARHLCMRLRTDVTWLLRGQTSDKFSQYKKSRWSLFILDNSKWMTFNSVAPGAALEPHS